MFLVDDGGHVVEKLSLNGDSVLSLGQRDRPAKFESGDPLDRPTDIAVHAGTGDLFVTDGYGNSRVHRFTSSGELVKSWGESGSDPGQFSLPHNLIVTQDDRVMVCDRENFRIQIFDLDGGFIEQWHSHRPFCIARGAGDDPLIFVGEGGSVIPNRQGIPRLGKPREGVRKRRHAGRTVWCQPARLRTRPVPRPPQHRRGLAWRRIRGRGRRGMDRHARRTTPVRGMAIAPEMATRRQLTRCASTGWLFDRFAAKRPETRAWSPVRNGAD